jgi:hypothetical protein
LLQDAPDPELDRLNKSRRICSSERSPSPSGEMVGAAADRIEQLFTS